MCNAQAVLASTVTVPDGSDGEWCPHARTYTHTHAHTNDMHPRAHTQHTHTQVVAGYTAFIPTGSSNTSGIRALRAMRALRPLRSITRFESLRAIVVCFLEVCVRVRA